MNRFFRWLQFSTMAIQLVEHFGRELTGAQKALKAAEVTEEFMQMGQSIDQETLVNTLNKHELLGNKKTKRQREAAAEEEAAEAAAAAAAIIETAEEAAALLEPPEEEEEEETEESEKDEKIAALEAELEALRNPPDNG